MTFTTDYQEILDAVNRFDPHKYARTRNHIRGEVSRLSPYISRGVISTKMVRDNLIERSYDLSKIEKFVQELAWRDYWQQIWFAKGEAINSDLKHTQTMVDHHQIPRAIVEASTGIDSIDSAILELYDTGYMHNHVRMYLAAIACNYGHSHWYSPARWHYYHLLDGDWASNALSWQWVAGANSNKKYIADQLNVNRYTDSVQKDSFLSGAYNRFPDMDVPEALKETMSPALTTLLPKHTLVELEPDLPTYIYNWYNLDPLWDYQIKANRVLLLEPSIFKKYPISEKSVTFMLALAENIEGIQIAVCEFGALAQGHSDMTFHYKEHPLNSAYQGQEHPRDWMSNVTGYHPSSFAFWKKGKKEFLKPELQMENNWDK
jgi:deoxyribodipyrimidine photo-lyase